MTGRTPHLGARRERPVAPPSPRYVPAVLHGRSVERARLARLLKEAAAGRSGVLVLLGEPGVGKSALLGELQDLATDFRILRTQGLESEAPLAFAALHRLLRPVGDLVDALPAPQAHALSIALGMQLHEPVEPFMVALATLSTLAEAAEAAPVLCLVDDAHWLDAASRDALLFTARRLTDERVAIVFTARISEGGEPLSQGLPALTLGGLDEDAAGAVVAERYGHAVPASVVASILAHTAGNALALVELPATLTAEQLAGTEALPERLPMTQAVERVFLERVRRLSEHGQTLLLVASADDSGRLRVVTEAASRLGVDADALSAAEQAHLVVTDADTIRVAHPLVRSATYQAATGGERRTAHRALADVLGSVGDSERRAWHLAASVDGPDSAAAEALTVTAVRSETRGAHDAAAAAFGRAATLTVDEARRARLLFDAARNSWLGGQAAMAVSTAAAARDLADDRLLRADIDRLRGRIEVNVGSASTARRIFVAAARSVAADDPERALEMTVAATLLAVYDAEARLDAAADGIATVPLTGESAPGSGASVLRPLLDALTADAEGRLSDALASLEVAVQRSRHLAPEQRTADPTRQRTRTASEPDVVANIGNTAVGLGHDTIARDCFTRVLAAGRTSGAVTVVLYALPRLAFPQLLLGEWSALRQAMHEAVDLARAVGQPALSAAPHSWLALMAALQGDPAYEEHRDRASDLAHGRLGALAHLISDLHRWAAAVVAASAGDHVGALRHYTSMQVPALRRMTAGELIAEAVRAGDRDLAQGQLEELSSFAERSQLAWPRATAEYGRAMLAEPMHAGEHFAAALLHHETSGRLFDRARVQLSYGESLRRGGKRVDARAQLRSALSTFEDLEVEPLATRAREELRASGETARKRDPSTLVALTPMETQVVQLVAQGLSNKEVAAQLWISPRTVAFHLRGVFAKLGVSSRGALQQLSLA